MAHRIRCLAKHLCASSSDLPSGERMGESLDQSGARSQDPNNPSTDVGTVKIFENDRIRVWDMCVEIGGNTGFHKHEHDYIFMQIGAGKCRTVIMDTVSHVSILVCHVSACSNHCKLFHNH